MISKGSVQRWVCTLCCRDHKRIDENEYDSLKIKYERLQAELLQTRIILYSWIELANMRTKDHR